MEKLSWILTLTSLAFGSLIFFKAKSTAGLPLMLFKVFGAALAPLVGFLGLLGTVLGFLVDSPWIITSGIVGATLNAYHIWLVTAPHDGFEKAFGPDWEDRLKSQQKSRMLSHRWTFWMPKPPKYHWQRDIPYREFLGVNEGDTPKLLCDIWYPIEPGESSGLGIIYLHGSAWHAGDKDMLTRPFFRHLVSQGHVVMDAAYRLCPEADIFDMVDDVRHAIRWLKENGSKYGVNTARIVLGGGSAGGHLALLVGYTPGHSELTPNNLKGVDTAVHGVFTHYGATDMNAVLEHASRFLPEKPSRLIEIALAVLSSIMNITVKESVEELGWFSASMMIGNPMGGSPEEVPEVYELTSPIAHVNATCPPTLLLQGEDDIIVPAQAVRELHHRLVEVGVPSIYVEFPQTNHGFDLIFPQFSPSAHAALHDLDRFLAMMV